jgi:hypothetical protein
MDEVSRKELKGRKPTKKTRLFATIQEQNIPVGL